MTAAAATRSLIVEREMPHPPEKVWRALTEAPLIEQWLMKNDCAPVVGHLFNFRATPMPHWNGVVDCEVLVVKPCQRLSYGWNMSGEEAAGGLRTVVTWTLTPTPKGVLVRMEQSGFRPEDEANYQGARMAGSGSSPASNGWPPGWADQYVTRADVQGEVAVAEGTAWRSEPGSRWRDDSGSCRRPSDQSAPIS